VNWYETAAKIEFSAVYTV